jgi:predicted DNA-binding protein (MmcQ/YjbR family)
MNKDGMEQYLAGFKGAESSYPFGSEALVFKVLGKMYALVSQQEEAPRVTLKVTPADGEILVGEYAAVSPGYYMNKKHWITIQLNGEVPDEVILDLARGSYELVVSKLTRANRQKLG